MVIGLQLTLKVSSTDGLLAKSQSRDFETSQGFSFGEILKAKEKQLQQEQAVSASSVAAALAAMQTLPIATNVPGVVTGTEPGKVNEQPALNADSLNITPVTASADPLIILAGTNQEQIAVDTGTVETQASTTAPDVEMLQSSDKPVGNFKFPGAVKTSRAKSTQIATPDMRIGDKTRNAPTKTNVQTDAVAPRQPALDILSFRAGADPKKIAFDAQQVAAQVGLPAPASEDSKPASMAPVATKALPIPGADSQTGEVAARSAAQVELNQARPLQPKLDILPVRDEINPGTIESRSSKTMPEVVVPQIKTNVTVKAEPAAPVTTAQISADEISIPVTDINIGQGSGEVTTQTASRKEIPASTLNRSIPLAEIPQYPAAAKAMDETTNKSEAGVTPATPLWVSSDIPPAQVETNPERTVAETKMAGMRIGSGAMTTTDTGSETEKAALQPAPDTLPARMGTIQGQTVFEANQVETQAGAGLPVSEVSHSTTQVPVAAMVSSSIRIDNETGNFLTQSTVYAEAASNTPDQPAIDILPAQTGMAHVFVAQQVETQDGADLPVGGVSQSTTQVPAAVAASSSIRIDNETENFLTRSTVYAEAASNTPDQPVIDILPAQTGTAHVFVTQQVETQASAGLPVGEVSQSTTQVPAAVAASSSIRIDNDTGNFLTRSTVYAEAVNNTPDQSAVDILPAEVETGQEKIASEARQVESQIGNPAPVSEFSQSTTEVPAAAVVSPGLGDDSQAGNTREQTTAQVETTFSTMIQDSPEILPVQIETESKKTDSGVNRAEIQPSAGMLAIDAPGYEAMEVRKAEVTSASVAQLLQNADMEVGKGSAQPTIQAMASSANPAQDLPQALAVSEKTVVGMEQVEKQVNSTASIKVLPFEAEIVGKVEVPVAVEIPSAMDISNAQPALQADSPTKTSAQSAPELQPARVGTGQEKLVVESDAVEMQAGVNASANAIPQAAAGVVEKARGLPTAETNPQPGGQNMISADFSQNLENVRLMSTNQSGVVDESSVPTLSANQKPAPVAFTSDALAKTQPSPDAVKTSQAEVENEKTQPAEKRSETARALESMIATTHPAQETFVVKAAEKGSTTQVNAQVVDVTRQILHQLSARIQSGPGSIRLQLNPKELGAIDVQMVSSAQGVSVTFYAEQASTGRLLATQMDQLRQSLTEAGIQLSGLNIGQHGQPRQEGGFLNQNPQFARTSQQAASLNETDIQETLRPERVIGPLGEVDYLI